MKDLENYECEGQIELEDYLQTLEKQDGKSLWVQKEKNVVNGLKGSSSMKQLVGIHQDGSVTTTTVNFVDDQ